MKNTRWSPKDMQDKGLIEVAGKFVKASSHVAVGKVDKIVPGSMINKKIINATKSEVNGVKFDSKLEEYLHGLLTTAKINFEFQVTIVLQNGFKYGTEAIRPIRIIMDFYLPSRNKYIDSKGWQTYDGKLKHKMLKKYFFDLDPNYLPTIEMPSTKAECNLLVNRLLYQP